MSANFLLPGLILLLVDPFNTEVGHQLSYITASLQTEANKAASMSEVTYVAMQPDICPWHHRHAGTENLGIFPDY